MEWYLTCRQVAHAGDALNTYCQLILAEILLIDYSVWHLVEKRLRKNKRDTREDLIERLKDCRCPDGAVRAALRDDIGAYWSAEAELVVELRNKIVHQGGFDTAGDVRRKIEELQLNGGSVIYPTDLPRNVIPVFVGADNQLKIDASTGFWATRHIQNHVHLMDQNLSTRFSLTTKRWRPKNEDYKLHSDFRGLPAPPGTSLPVKPPQHSFLGPFPELQPIPSYDPMPDEKETKCAQTWNKVFPELDEFVKSYCKEAEIHICALNSGRCGNIRNDTLNGHDLLLEYGLTRLDTDGSKRENLGMRLRQKNFEPFVTIWSTNSQMQDFELIEFSEVIKEYLRSCIDKTLTK